MLIWADLLFAWLCFGFLSAQHKYFGSSCMVFSGHLADRITLTNYILAVSVICGWMYRGFGPLEGNYYEFRVANLIVNCCNAKLD